MIQLDARKAHPPGSFEEICQGGEVFHRPHGGEGSIVNSSQAAGRSEAGKYPAIAGW